MKRIIAIILTIMLSIVFVGCEIELPERINTTTIKSEIISAKVITVSKDKWYAGNAYHYELIADVYNEEYNLNATLEVSDSGMFSSINWDMDEGDNIEVIMHIFINTENGEVIKRESVDFA